MKDEQWYKVIQTNLNSNFQIIKSLLPNMLSKKHGNDSTATINFKIYKKSWLGGNLVFK